MEPLPFPMTPTDQLRIAYAARWVESAEAEVKRRYETFCELRRSQGTPCPHCGEDLEPGLPSHCSHCGADLVPIRGSWSQAPAPPDNIPIPTLIAARRRRLRANLRQSLWSLTAINLICLYVDLTRGRLITWPTLVLCLLGIGCWDLNRIPAQVRAQITRDWDVWRREWDHWYQGQRWILCPGWHTRIVPD